MVFKRKKRDINILAAKFREVFNNDAVIIQKITETEIPIQSNHVFWFNLARVMYPDLQPRALFESDYVLGNYRYFEKYKTRIAEIIQNLIGKFLIYIIHTKFF